jgi:hypothetical protein
MRVSVEFVGPMRRPWPQRRRDVEAADGASITTVLGTLGYVADEARHFSFLVNGTKANPETALRAQDQLSVLLMVGGG